MYFHSLNNKSLIFKYAALDNWAEVSKSLDKMSEREILFSDNLLEIALLSSIHNNQYEKSLYYVDKLPSNTESRINLKALACYKVGLYQPALSYLDKLKNPDEVAPRILLSNILKKMGNYEGSISALENHQDLTSVKVELASLYEMIGDDDACMRTIKQARKESPRDRKIEFNYSMQLLKRQDWERGWKHFESRMYCLPTTFFNHRFPIRANKETFKEKTFLNLFCEQGLGDYIQFLRYAYLLYEKGFNVKLFNIERNMLCGEHLKCTPQNPTIEDGSAVSCSIMSLPHLTQTAEPIKISTSKKLTRGPKKVGICWAGNPLHPNDALRSIPLKYFRRLSFIPGIKLYSLQKDLRPRKYSPCGVAVDYTADCDPFKLVDLSDKLTTIDNTMSIVKQLDLVITADTAVAHMSANLGIPTWILISCPNDWRWGISESSTPWYDSVTLFRKKYKQSWDKVFDVVENNLRSSTRYKNKENT